MKNFIYYLLFLISCISLFTSCKKTDVKSSAIKPEKKMEDVLYNTRLKLVYLDKDTVYTLSNMFERKDGEQLVIEEGTLIKVSTAAGSNAGITIHAGGAIIANGTTANPIVFTSNDFTGNQKRNWAGIHIIGKSTHNDITDAVDAEDFSGSLRYVRIEFSNLTLSRVGRRTLVDNVQVSYAGSSASYKISGGTFNAKYLISYACSGEADYYITDGYTGKMQNILAYRHPYFGSLENNAAKQLTGLFIENNATNPVNAKPVTNPTISNLTVMGPNAQPGTLAVYNDENIKSAALITTNNAHFKICNSMFMSFRKGWYLNDSLTSYNVHYKKSIFSNSILHGNNNAEVFYLEKNGYNPYMSADFKRYVLDSLQNNKLYKSANDFMLENPFQYDNAINPLPKVNSPVLKDAFFDIESSSNTFYTKVTYIGALSANDNWLQGWTNFNPLKTNYNIPQ